LTRILWDGARRAPANWRSVGPARAEALVSEGLPVATGAADAAYLGPALSGVPLWQVTGVLEEVWRVLRPGGWIRVCVHDLDAAMTAYRAGETDFFWSYDWRHPSGALVEQLLQSGDARSLFTAPLVVELLERAGFADIRVERFGATSSGDDLLTRPDRLAQHCCFIDAARPADVARAPVESAPAQVHLSWADERCRSVAVSWCGPVGAEGSVEFRELGGRACWSAPGRAEPGVESERAPLVFRAVSGELEPGARYAYDVVNEIDGRRHVASGGSFSSLPPDPSAAVSFAFVADTGIAGRPDGLCDGARRVVAELCRTDASFVLAGGDLAYRLGDPRLQTAGEGVRAWLDQMAPVAAHRPLLVQYGNHEVELGERLRDWAPYFVPPGRRGGASGACYSFDAGACHVAGLFAPTEDLAPADCAWLEADLAAARGSGSRWLVVFQHQPLFAHGTSHPADGRIRAALAPTLERQGVDLHLSAHDQSFERTLPLRRAWEAPVAGSASRDRYLRGSGVVYAKVSPAGKRSDRGRGFSRLAAPLPPYVAVADDTRHHLAHVRVNHHELVMETFGFMDASAPLELVDRFTISYGHGAATQDADADRWDGSAEARGAVERSNTMISDPDETSV
jgi:acid phosphatase type 7